MKATYGVAMVALFLELAAAPVVFGQGAGGPDGRGVAGHVAESAAPATRQNTSRDSAPGDPEPRRLLLPELYELARAMSPRLRAAEAGVAAARARESWAGFPPDPMIELGAMNLSLPGLRADMPASMAPSIQAMQTIPFPGKLGLNRKLAKQDTRAEAAEAAEAWWTVRSRVASAFYELYAIDQSLAVMRETLGLMQSFEAVARSLYATGSGRQTDVLRASVEVARLRTDIARLEASREGAAARLNAALGRAADTPVPSPALSPLPLELPALDTLQRWAEESSPLLEGLRIRVEQARTRRDLAWREIWPDLTVGVQYGQNHGPMGTERMGSAMIGFSVPVFAGRRQLELREEAAALEQATEATLAEQRADVAARILELTATLERNRTLIDLYRREILPQAAANVESALAAYRAGMVDFLTLIEAQTSKQDYERELHELVAEYGAAIAELERTLGRELPVTGDILAEVP